MRAAIFLVLVGCATHGGSPDPIDPTVETGPFLPLLCTGGTPGEVNCPFNNVDFSDLGLAGARLQFIAQALGSGLYMNEMTWTAGPEGMHLEHVEMLVNETVFPIADVIDLPPGGSLTTNTIAVVGFTPTNNINFRFDAL